MSYSFSTPKNSKLLLAKLFLQTAEKVSKKSQKACTSNLSLQVIKDVLILKISFNYIFFLLILKTYFLKMNYLYIGREISWFRLQKLLFWPPSTYLQRFFLVVHHVPDFTFSKLLSVKAQIQYLDILDTNFRAFI